MFIVLETAWAWVDEGFPSVALDGDGAVLKFDTREEAEKYSSENMQRGLVVEIDEHKPNKIMKIVVEGGVVVGVENLPEGWYYQVDDRD